VKVYHAGVVYKRRAASLSHARDLVHEIKSAIARGEWPPNPKPKVMRFDQLLEDYREAKRREHKSVMASDIGYRRLLDRFGGRRADAITAAEVEQWRDEMRDSFAPATVNLHLAILRAILRLAVRNHKLDAAALPAIAGLKANNTRVRYLTDDEESRLIAALPAWLRPLITIAIRTGMRRGELLKLKWEDIDFTSGSIFVRTSKSGEGRRMPMSPTARRTLGALWQARRERMSARVVNRSEASGYVFTAPEGGFMANLARAWYPALERAEIADLHFHDLRHTFASRLVMNGVDLYRVQILMGHKTPTMTLRYAHLSPQHLRAAVATLDAPGAKPWATPAEAR
jgi:integrase